MCDGHFRTESLAVSQFLLFLTTTLGALMLMLKRLPAGGVAPGVAAASELLRKASLVVLLVTVHAMAGRRVARRGRRAALRAGACPRAPLVQP